MYFADNFPKKIVNLSGRIKVGMANMKINISPKYRKKLKIKDLINCIKNLSILVNFVFFLYI